MTCPECGAPMDVDHCCIISELVYRWGEGHPRQRLAAAALCTACECCIELTREQLRGVAAAERSERS